MDEQWDADDFEPNVAVPHATTAANKWEGEDEDDDVKESWEDEEEEKKDVEKNIEVKPKPKPKKTIAEKIAEKERQQLELQSRQETIEELTPEEKLAEKLRQQKLQEESDLELARETFGIIDKVTGIDEMNPSTKEEFNELADTLSRKLNCYSKHPEFPAFIEDLVRNVCVSLNSNDLKKIKTTLHNMYFEKQKVEKGDKSKKNKGKGKAQLKMDGDNVLLNDYSAYGDAYDDVSDGVYDDFM